MVDRRSFRTHANFSALILAGSIAIFSGCADPRPAASASGSGSTSGGSKACTLCHGDSTRLASATNPQLPAAPPKGSNGETATTDRAVGAHQLHLQDGSFRPAIACSECHDVPTTVAHANGKVDLTFGPLATKGGAAPQWNGSSCSASYCHGGFTGGDASNAPVWTQARASACGTCHGLPPAAPHPAVGAGSSCGTCHTGYTATTVNLATHIDGTVDVNLTCTSCHGDATRANTALNPTLSAAPPSGSKGETAVTSRAVGAHQAHLNAGAIGPAMACTSCHAPVTSTTHSNGTADVAFGGLALTGGATPSWSGTTCSNVYCHGNFTGGNKSYEPSWTSPAATTCGTCHALPPAAPHPQSTDCSTCHTGYTATTVNVATHLNGTVDVNLTCTSCHGDPTRAATALNPQLAVAPPQDTQGNTATTARGVGAHQRHLVAGALSSGTACAECHAPVASTTHSNGWSTCASAPWRRWVAPRRPGTGRVVPRATATATSATATPPTSRPGPRRRPAPAAPVTACPPAERTRPAPPARAATPATPPPRSTWRTT